ncbi:MAG TPA: aminotransferase class IV [Solirubrobacteraceae bacterium]|nr:aminotransferase class IV [Solirubrobacteraceae bacterium]
MAQRFDKLPEADASRGVFETILVAGARAHELERHLARLRDSARALYAEALPPGLAGEAAAAARGHASARMRVEFAPGGAASIAVSPFDAVLPEQPVTLEPVIVAAGFGAHKLCDRSWLEAVEGSVEGERARPLLVTAAGAVLETTRANVFLERDGVLATPPLDGAILPGVTRSLVISAARRLQIALIERPLGLDDLAAADAILLTSSLRLIERSAPSAVGERLREALAAEIA